MLIAGDEDRLWNSGRMARNIAATRKAKGLETQALIYPDAGHDLGGGSAEPRVDPRGGGTPKQVPGRVPMPRRRWWRSWRRRCVPRRGYRHSSIAIPACAGMAKFAE